MYGEIITLGSHVRLPAPPRLPSVNQNVLWRDIDLLGTPGRVQLDIYMTARRAVMSENRGILRYCLERSRYRHGFQILLLLQPLVQLVDPDVSSLLE